MQGRLRVAVVGAALLALGGCAADGRIPLHEAITDIPTKLDTVMPPCTPPAAPAPPDVARIGQQRIANINAAIHARLLGQTSNLPLFNQQAAQAVLDVALQLITAAGNANRTAPVTDAVAPADAAQFTVKAIQHFNTALHQHGLTAPAPQPVDPAAAAAFRQDLDEFNRILVQYVSAYIEGKYVDRFGNKLPAPTFSRTVGDTEIAGVLSVVLDVVGDFVLQTPIWVDATAKPTKYFPAAFNTGDTPSTATPAGAKASAPAGGAKTPAPSAAAAPAAGVLVPTAALVTTSDGDAGAPPLFPRYALVAQGACGIDAMKAEAIEYLGQVAASRASSLGGLVSGTVGGTGVSFVVFEKVSIGDNQTLQVIVKALLAKLAERVAAEGTYRLLLNVNDTGFESLPPLIQAVLTKTAK